MAAEEKIHLDVAAKRCVQDFEDLEKGGKKLCDAWASERSVETILIVYHLR